MSSTPNDQSQSFYSAMIEHGLYSNERNLRNFLDAIFSGISFLGRNVLDIGGGDGLLSFYVVDRGAAKAVCLEPEAAGSSAGVSERFAAAHMALGYGDRVVMVPVTFQDFDPAGKKFDIVVSHASINHLDELACSTLMTDKKSRMVYLQLFHKLKNMLNPGAVVIIFDCSRHNFFQALGIKNPIARSIEWDKHQDPAVWKELLLEAGFIKPLIRWQSLNSFGRLGRLLLANRFMAYFFTSGFYLTVENP
ncbi:MAG TPA: class I SAM-dependent methyltransferase [Methylocella sp.]|nr:class I SAM-dependent methyltransferase [Methylocella sp.]